MADTPDTTRLIATLKENFQGDAEINYEWLQRARESYRFYTGIQQWDPAVVQELRASGRPALTINRILSTVHMPCGYQRRNRQDFKLYPRRGGTRPVAELGTALLKHTMDISRGQHQGSEAFLDGCVCGKGWLGLSIAYENDPLYGDLIVRKESPFGMLEDQTNKSLDINEGQRVVKTEWRAKREIALKYDKSDKELEEASEHPQWWDEQDQTLLEIPDYQPYDFDLLSLDDRAARGDRLFKRTMYFVKDCWWKEWENVPFLIHPPSGTLKRLTMVQAKIIAERMLTDGMLAGEVRIVERPAPVLYRAVTLGDLLLEYEEDPLRGVTRFPFVRFCPYVADGFIMGLVDNIKQPQEELNKRRSQTLHNANQTANAGYDVTRVADDDALQDLRRNGSKPGYVLDLSKFGGAATLRQPPPLDTAHFTLAERAAQDIKEISGVNDDLTGMNAKASESGKARAIRQDAGLTVNEIIFDHFDLTMQDFGEVLWEVIRSGETYSTEEVEAVVTESSLKAFLVPDPQTGQPTVDLSPMRRWDIGRYGVVVDRGANTPTMRMAMADQMLEVAKAFPQLPLADMILEFMDIPGKEEVIQRIQQMQAAQQQAAQQQQQAVAMQATG